LHDTIINIFITYSIIQGSAVADLEPDSTSADSQALQFISGASALGFLSAGLEPIWRRLGAYINGLFIDSFLTPNCLFSLHQPRILQLAQAITYNFLLSVQNQFPSQNFKIPRAITIK
ncbi:hypothetical protein PSTT_10314, partial [Puccinia striiformis]